MWSVSRAGRARDGLDQRAAGDQVLIGHAAKAWRELRTVNDRVRFRGLTADEGEAVLLQQAKMRRVGLAIEQVGAAAPDQSPDEVGVLPVTVPDARGVVAAKVDL